MILVESEANSWKTEYAALGNNNAKFRNNQIHKALDRLGSKQYPSQKQGVSIWFRKIENVSIEQNPLDFNLFNEWYSSKQNALNKFTVTKKRLGSWTGSKQSCFNPCTYMNANGQKASLRNQLSIYITCRQEHALWVLRIAFCRHLFGSKNFVSLSQSS